MDILVCLKQTFDTEEKVTVENGQIIEDGVKWIINPYDEYALEEALKLKEQFGGKVTVITIGPDRAESALRTALAMGADEAILLNDVLFNGDEYTISGVLAAVVKKLPFDLIIAGNMAIDTGAAQGGPRLAELLGIPCVSSVTKLKVEGDHVRIVRDAEGDEEVIEAALPILLTAQQGLNEPRYPSLPGIMKAKKKPLLVLSAADLQIQPEDIEPKTEVIDQFVPVKKQAGTVLQGELKEQVRQLAQLLRTEEKVV